MLEVKVDIMRLQELDAMLNFLPEHALAAGRRAVEHTIEVVEEEVVNELAMNFNVERGELQSRVYSTEVVRPLRQFIVGTVHLSPRPIKLNRFPTRQAPGGVYYSPYRSGSARLVKGAFGPDIAKLGHGVFRRRGKSRLPIKRVPGHSLRGDSVALGALDRVRERVPDILFRAANEEIRKALQDATAGRPAVGVMHVNRAFTNALLSRGRVSSF